jgi:hypothetical protein
MVGAAGVDQLANVSTAGFVYNATSNALSVTGNITGGNLTSLGTFSSSVFLATNGLLLTANTITANYTVGSGYNALSIGPITTANNVSVTVASGQRWVIL